MAENRFAKLEALFDQAMSLDPAAREAFIASQTAQDAELGKALADLVRHGADETGYSDAVGSIAESALGVSGNGLEPGSRVGNVEIVRRIGTGGMGDVYLGTQSEPLKRRVAVKLVRFGVARESLLARFEAERQVLARMNHANIAQVYDAGALENGQPYFVMEHVQGLPVDEFCATRQPGLAERLDLFAKICDGVQHAHQRGVIHRDLKPSNVLVDDDGNPKIIDFGIAKLIEDTGQDTRLTQVDETIGTPQYMSPEQAVFHNEEIDTRSDVYALGVLLFELLTGKSPFDTEGRTPLEIRELIARTDAPKPSSIMTADMPFAAREIAGDLDWIVGKSLAREKDRRYGSPAELAADIERHRNAEPVLAGPDEVSYRLRKFVRRHKTGVAVSAVALVTIFAGLAGTSIGLLRALEAERAAAESAEIANQTVTFVEDLFSAADSTKVRGAQITAKEVVDQGVIQLRSNEELPWALRASMLQTMARVYSGLGLYTDALPLLEESTTLYTSNIERLADRSAPYFAAQLEYIEILKILGESERAETLLDELIESQVEAFGPEDRRLVDSYILKLNFFTGEADAAAARAHFEKTMALLDATGASDLDRSRLLTIMAFIYVEGASFDEGIEAGRKALELRTDALGPDHWSTLIARANLAWYLTRSRRYKEAEQQYDGIVGVKKKIYGEDHFSLGITLFNLGSLQRDLGDYQDALANYLRARDIWADQLGPGHSYVTATISNIAQLYYDLNRNEESEAMYLDLIELERRTLDEDDPRRAYALNNLGMVYHAIGELDKAETFLSEARDLRIRTLGEGHDLLLDGYINLGRLYRDKGKLEQAHDNFRKAIDIGTERFDADSPIVGLGRLEMGILLIEQDEPKKAVAYLEDAMPAFAAAYPDDFWGNGQLKSTYGEALMLSGDLPRAEEQMTDGLATLLASEDRGGRHTREAIERLIRLYERTGDDKRKAEMEALFEEIRTEGR
ncbi:serine/threonine-protein kinase [Wenzhouxiangella sp. XN24]|uniref:serine/threonine-protein kinase n=1 Tax=Wenzhouxiangella sp. XN24 TaxID=2713569 RepID=UPI0013EDCB36|nr:serine/threonine-protein kinase [Wenzhouxiangella sp. XN24]NGX16290.1 serine/threonine protein kinase [Wenzhouxiangella sp. XN24]